MARKKARKMPPLSNAEKKTLARIRRAGTFLVSPKYRPTQAVKNLLEKNIIRELPGLFEDARQGYQAIE